MNVLHLHRLRELRQPQILRPASHQLDIATPDFSSG